MYLHSDLIKIKDTNLKYTNYRSMINQKLCYRQTQIKWRSKTKKLRANMENLLDENRTIKFILDKKQNGGRNNEHTKNQYTVTTSQKVSKTTNRQVLIYCFSRKIELINRSKTTCEESPIFFLLSNM